MKQILKNKKFLYSFLFLLLLLIIGIFLFIYFSGINKLKILDAKINISATTNSSTPTITTPILEYEKIDYYVPVTGFKELRNNITSDELKNNSLIVKSTDFETIKKFFPSQNIEQTPDDTTFIDTIANGNRIGLVKWNELTPKFKLLSIDNQFFFDKNLDLTKYPFRVSQKVNDIKLSEDNFDQKSINRIIATGEIIPARTVDKIMRTKNDYLWPFREVKDFMSKYDARISTFEAALQGNGNGNVCALNCFTFIGNEKVMDGMKYAGINLVSLADNHSMSAGTDGIDNTIKLMNNSGIKTIGASSTNNEDATKPEILDINGIKYGFIAYNDIPSINDWATDSKGGTARIDDNDYKIIEGRAAKDVKRARDAGAQFIIAMMHWGAREYTNEPLPHQKDLAHNLIDSGVDLIVGDHPHWVMATEFYTPKSGGEPKFIYYGIGNFIFDQDWSTETSQGSLMEMNFYKDKLLSLKIYPHHIYQSQPRMVGENTSEYKQIFDRIWQYTGRI